MHPSFAFEFPKEWRLPTESELSGESLRKESSNKYAKVEADFNGDGKLDYAYLLKSQVYSGEGLIVRLSSSSNYSWEVLNEINWGEKYPNVDLVMGIDLASPGKLKTACGKGYWECGHDEPETIELSLPSIWHYRFESAASIWYWQASTSSFKQIWIRD